MRNIFTIAAVSVLSVTTVVAETAPGNVAFEDGSVMASLTGSAGDAAAGRKTGPKDGLNGMRLDQIAEICRHISKVPSIGYCFCDDLSDFATFFHCRLIFVDE